MKAITGQFVIQSFCSDGGYGNAEERPERQSESREGGTGVSLFFVQSTCCPFVLKALNLGVRGRAPGWDCKKYWQRVNPRLEVLVVLLGSQLEQISLTTIVVIIIHPIVDAGEDIVEGITHGDEVSNFVLHMPEKALLRGIIPAVTAPGHGLDKFCVL